MIEIAAAATVVIVKYPCCDDKPSVVDLFVQTTSTMKACMVGEILNQGSERHKNPLNAAGYLTTTIF